MVPTSTSARDCFQGKCIIMTAGAGRKSTANAKSRRKQLKSHCFCYSAQIPSLFSHLFSDDILSFALLLAFKGIQSLIRVRLGWWLQAAASLFYILLELREEEEERRKMERRLQGQPRTRCLPDYSSMGGDYLYATQRLWRPASCSTRVQRGDSS